MLVSRYEVAVLCAVHAPDADGDPRNFHCHLLFSTRVLGTQGFEGKTRVLDDQVTGPQEVRSLRQAVADCINQHLQRAQQQERVDCRSLEAQAQSAAQSGDLSAVMKLSRSPTRHLGRAATAARRCGRASSIKIGNDAIQRDNAELQRIARRWAWSPKVRGGIRCPETSRHANHAASSSSLKSLYLGASGLSSDGRAYLEALADTVRRNADLYAAAVHQDRRRERRDVIEREAASQRERIRSVHVETLAAKEALSLARRSRGDAMVRTEQARTALQQLDQQQPSRARFLSRREWVRKRRQQQKAVIENEAAEQAAHLHVWRKDRAVEMAISKERKIKNEAEHLPHPEAEESPAYGAHIPTQCGGKLGADLMALAASRRKRPLSP